MWSYTAVRVGHYMVTVLTPPAHHLASVPSKLFDIMCYGKQTVLQGMSDNLASAQNHQAL